MVVVETGAIGALLAAFDMILWYCNVSKVLGPGKMVLDVVGTM